MAEGKLHFCQQKFQWRQRPFSTSPRQDENMPSLVDTAVEKSPFYRAMQGPSGIFSFWLGIFATLLGINARSLKCLESFQNMVLGMLSQISNLLMESCTDQAISWEMSQTDLVLDRRDSAHQWKGQVGSEKLIDFKSVELENGSDALGEMGSQKCEMGSRCDFCPSSQNIYATFGYCPP